MDEIRQHEYDELIKRQTKVETMKIPFQLTCPVALSHLYYDFLDALCNFELGPPGIFHFWGIFSETCFRRLNFRACNYHRTAGKQLRRKKKKTVKRILIVSSFSNLGKQISLHVFSISTPSEAFLSWQASLFHKHSKNNLWTLPYHSQVWKCKFHGSLFFQPPDVDERRRVFYCVFSRNRERSVLRWGCFPPTQVATMWPEDS